MIVSGVDIKENLIRNLDEELLKILLKDRTTQNNIIWATDSYIENGPSYYPKAEMTVKSVTGYKGNIIRPRANKSKKDQNIRIKKKAEVFTPSWVCNAQNNLVDNAWFERESVFNFETDKGWVVNAEKIVFSDVKGKTWEDYVLANRLEISCGEAPYLVSRYDTVSGEWLDVNNRIGILDRKIRVVNENVTDDVLWFEWVKKAFQSSYGYEWQGDSLLIARENLLFTFVDYYQDRFGKEPSLKMLMEIAYIVSWNIWQMDGIKYVVPMSCDNEEFQISIDNLLSDDESKCGCIGCKTGDHSKHNGIYAKIKDWRKKESFTFFSMLPETPSNNKRGNK